MRRNRVGLWVLVILIGMAASAQAMQVREFGARFDLTLQPLYAAGEVHWNFDLGAYALLDLNGAWGVRASAGFDVLNAGPYASLGAIRTVVEHVYLEGDVTLQWSFHASTPTVVADAGIRFTGDPDGSVRSQLAIFPASWTLAAASGAPTSFSFSPSFTVYGAVVLETGLLVGEAATVTFLRVPSLSVQPVFAIGGGWMLATRFTTNLGLDLPEAP
jgi:hypothetical protein